MEKPLPEHFGITQQQIDAFKRRSEKFEYLILFITIGLILIITPLFTYFYIYPTFQDIIITLYFGIMSLCPIIIVVALVTLVPRGIFYLIERSSRFYNSIQKFENSVKSYNSWRRKIEQEWKRTQQDFWLSLTGHEFERELANLFARFGYVSSVTRGSGDQGIDIILYKDDKKIIVQCKAHKKPVGPHVIRDLYGTLTKSDADEAILASLSGWTSGVSKFVAGEPIKLLSLEDIINMQKQLSTRNES